MKLAERDAGAAAGIENRGRLQVDESKALGHTLPDFALQDGRTVVRRGRALERTTHLLAVEQHRPGVALSGLHSHP